MPRKIGHFKMALAARAPAGHALLQIQGLTKHYGRVEALHDVTFDVREGEILGLIGPNGAGKTTLFECLAGMLPAEAGRFLRDGQPVAAGSIRSTLFYLPDAIVPWPHETVAWALNFVGDLFGVAPGRRAEAIADFDLTSLLGVRMGRLSKGQRKRALLALGSTTPQPCWLADEPFDGLDLRQTREVGATLRRLAAAGRTLFLSIHQIGDAARVCDRFVLLADGRVRGTGTFEDLLARVPAGAAPASLEEVFLALT